MVTSVAVPKSMVKETVNPMFQDQQLGSEERLKALVEFAKLVDLEEVVWEQGEQRIAFKRRVASAAPPLQVVKTAAHAPAKEPAAPAAPKVQSVLSPMVGTFWRGAAKERPPLVVEGDVVSAGQRLGVVIAMNIPKDVISPAAGRIARIFVENGKPAEYGQKLFEIEPGGEPGRPA